MINKDSFSSIEENNPKNPNKRRNYSNSANTVRTILAICASAIILLSCIAYLYTRDTSTLLPSAPMALIAAPVFKYYFPDKKA
jgi:hypothetical protein